MDPRLNDLAVAIVGYVTEHDGYVTKTKLLKLLYLLDVEFYRVHGKTFTGFEWKYFHLGPWTREFDPLLDTLLSRGYLIELTSARSEFDTKFLHAKESIDLRRPFEGYRDEAILKIILDTWGSSTTAEILDYVYFRTEPMEYGIRNENLDFSKVLPHTPGIYKRSSSKTASGRIEALRREFKQKIGARPSRPTFQFTEPRYDEEFREAMKKLDTGEL